MSSWRGAPIEVNITIERVLLSDLPTWLGRSTFLDKLISKALEDNAKGSVWVYSDAHGGQTTFVGEKVEAFLNKHVDEENDTIEIEMEGTSSGYYHPGTRYDPPEGEDERDITEIRLVQDGYDDIELDDIVSFENQFEHEIYFADVDTSW
jgi:hypothetical protein